MRLAPSSSSSLSSSSSESSRSSEAAALAPPSPDFDQPDLGDLPAVANADSEPESSPQPGPQEPQEPLLDRDQSPVASVQHGDRDSEADDHPPPDDFDSDSESDDDAGYGADDDGSDGNGSGSEDSSDDDSDDDPPIPPPPQEVDEAKLSEQDLFARRTSTQRFRGPFYFCNSKAFIKGPHSWKRTFLICRNAETLEGQANRSFKASSKALIGMCFNDFLFLILCAEFILPIWYMFALQHQESHFSHFSQAAFRDYFPCENWSSAALLLWSISSSVDGESFDRLIDILKSPKFRSSDCRKFKFVF